MISPFNPIVNAMMASYQQAMSKGMPPDQAAVYVKSLAQQDIAPFVDLPALLKQVQQLKQTPVQRPQTPNVRQQVESLSQAMRPSRGLSAIRPDAMSRAPAVDPMMRGLGAVDAGAMENPRGFNAGGIVAFAGEDNKQLVQDQPTITAANLPKPRSTEDIYKYYADIMGQGYVPAFKKYEDEAEQIEKEMGIGEYAESLAQEAELLDKQEKRSLEELMQDKEGSRRQEAADIAKAASGSRSLLEAMSKARSPAVERERELEKEIRKARDEREKARINLTKAKETAKTNRTTAAVNRLDKAETRMLDAEKTLSDRVFQRDTLEREIQGRKEVAGIEAGARENLARLESSLRMGLQERAGQIEADIKRGTASLEDQLGWDYLTTLKTKGADDPLTKAAFKRYQDAMAARGLGRATAAPIDVTQAQPAGGAAPGQRSTAGGTNYQILQD
jgi:hypothetical protein